MKLRFKPITTELGALAERIVYRRDHSVGEELRDLLAADANLITEAIEQMNKMQERYGRAEEALERVAKRAQYLNVRNANGADRDELNDIVVGIEGVARDALLSARGFDG